MRLLLLLTALTLLPSLTGNTQVDLTGTVEYDLAYLNVPEHMQTASSARATGMRLIASAQRTRVEYIGGNASSPIVIANAEAKESVVLMDLFGVKLALIGDDGAAAASDSTAANVYTYSGNTREIAGLPCEQAFVLYADSTQTEVWFTRAYRCYDERFVGLPGLPLSYTLVENGYTLTATAKSVSPEKVNPTLFDIPEGYTPMTEAAFQSFMKTLGQ